MAVKEETTWLMCYNAIPFSKEEVEDLRSNGLDITQPFNCLGELQEKFSYISENCDTELINRLWQFIGGNGRNHKNLQLKVTNDLG